MGVPDGPPYYAPAAQGRARDRGGPPTFSVIVPCYQAADTVGAAVASVLAQSSPAHEVIVCDDGSTDALEEALAPYMDRISVLHQTNRGVAAARNLGLHNATSEFVVVCDADDAYLATLLEELQALAMVRSDLDILCTDFFLEVDGTVLGQGRPDPATFVSDNQRLGIIRHNFVPGCSAFRRELFLHAGGYDESLACAEDWDCWVRLILGGATAGLVHRALARVRIRPDSLTSSLTRLLSGQEAVLQKVLTRRDLSQAERDAAQLHLVAVSRSLELEWAKDAIREGDVEQVRRRSLDIARNPDHDFRSRLKAATAAVAPRWVHHRARGRVRADHRIDHLGV
jgi:glycosyltransferase involved in cell wall biosynthesis